MTRQTAEWVEEIVYGRAFDQSQDTRDRPLAPTQAGNQPLVKTGLMRASLGVLESSETTAKIGVSGAAAEYAPPGVNRLNRVREQADGHFQGRIKLPSR